MGYGNKIYQSAMEELTRRRQAAESAARDRLEDFYARQPAAREVKAAMASNAAGAAKVVLSGGDVRSELEKLKQRGAALSAEYDRLLAKEGLTRADVAPRYTCPLCRDTGFVDGRMCTCLKNLQRSLAYEKLNMDVPLERCTFEAFSLEYYRDDPRAYRQMSGILAACKEYAAKFRADSPSLLFWGGTGLGKTHLSLAIAQAAIEKGFGVIYSSVQSLAVALERERFDRRGEEDPQDTGGQLVSCDLLILDDLGAEFPSNYVNASLANILNARMLANRPTLISTNLNAEELEKRYSPRVCSRIMGTYGKMEFLGRDIRIDRRKHQNAARQNL